MTKDEEAAKQYCNYECLPYAPNGDYTLAFLAGIEHERKRSKVLLDAVRYMNHRFNGTHPTDNYIQSTKAKFVIEEALRKYRDKGE